MQVLSLASALLAFIAAAFWLWSSRPKLPERVPSLYGTSSPEQQQLVDALRTQSRRNAWGAIAAAGSALCQGLSILLSA